MSIEKYNAHKKKSNFQFFFWRIAVTCYRFFRFYIVPDKIWIYFQFKKKLGYYPDLNSPKTIEEKLNWLKLNDREPYYTLCADKYESRKVISELLETDKYSIPIYFHSYCYKDLVPENFPDVPFVLKCNHDNNSWICIDDKNRFDWEKIRSFYRERLCLNFYWTNREWPYKNIKPLVYAEAFIQDKEKSLNEYMYYCFSGKIEFIEYSVAYKGKKIYRFVDRHHYPLPSNYIFGSEVNHIDEKEYSILSGREEMDSIVLQIASKFQNFIRVDLYNVDGKIYVGELTFYDSAGYPVVKPKEWNNKISNLLSTKK